MLRILTKPPVILYKYKYQLLERRRPGGMGAGPHDKRFWTKKSLLLTIFASFVTYDVLWLMLLNIEQASAAKRGVSP